MTTMQIFILLCGLAAVLYGLITSRQILSLSTGNEKMVSIANAIQEGARAYLNRQYMTIGIVGIVIFVLIWIVFGLSSGIGFLIALPGFITYASTGWLIEGVPKYSFGYVSLPIVLSVASVSVLTAPLGAKLSSKVNKNTLRKIFAIFLLLVCVSLVINQFY